MIIKYLNSNLDKPQRPHGGKKAHFLIFNNTFISMLCFHYKEFKTSVLKQ